MNNADATLNRAKKPYKCSRCERRFPSPEAGSAHLEKKHNGEGFLSWSRVLKGVRIK